MTYCIWNNGKWQFSINTVVYLEIYLREFPFLGLVCYVVGVDRNTLYVILSTDFRIREGSWSETVWYWKGKGILQFYPKGNLLNSRNTPAMVQYHVKGDNVWWEEGNYYCLCPVQNIPGIFLLGSFVPVSCSHVIYCYGLDSSFSVGGWFARKARGDSSQ